MKALLLALTLAAPHRYTAADAQQLFQDANGAYFKGDYDQAAQKYQQLVDDGWAGADVEYNLGTALLAEGKLGQAILALERARRLAPGDDDIQDNLDRARHELVDKVTGAGDEPFISRVADLAPVSAVGIIFLAGWVLFWLALLVRRLMKLRAVTALAAALGAVASLVAGGLLGVQWYALERLHPAVVVGQTVPAREGPNAASKASFELHEGTELRIVDHDGDWVRVRLRNGLEGWAEAKGVEEI